MEPTSRMPPGRDRGRALVADVLLALGIGLVQVLSLVVSERVGRSPDWRAPDALAWLLLLAGPAALLVRRRWPLGVLAVTVAAGLAYAARTYPEGPSSLAGYPALWTVALTVPRRQAWLAAGATALAVAGAELFLYGDTMFDGEPLYAAVTVLAAMWWGEAVRARRAYVAELRDRAERAERTREEEARRRVDEERLRIARELHDVVAHSMSVIAVQAGVAHHVIDRRPEQARTALATVETTTRAALVEMRRLLGVLRQPDEPAGSLTPSPGLADLPRLIDQFTEAGLTVDLSVAGVPERVPDGVDLSAFRIVQEGLTNVLRHGGPEARLAIHHEPGQLRVAISDDGSGRKPQPTGGHGLIGMRERVAIFGGTLTAGPRPGGGFELTATLPFEAAMNGRAA